MIVPEPEVGADHMILIEPEVRDGTRDCRRTGSGGGSCDSLQTRSVAVTRDSRRTRTGVVHVNPPNQKWH